MQKLYEEDAYLRSFTSTVVSCEKAKKGWEIVLRETAFYPEGGGQPADHGILMDAETGQTAQVLDVRGRGGIIVHICDAPFPIGADVTGQIDWDRRFDHMQQHSGEHICSGMICETFHCDNVGFHLGASCIEIDFNTVIAWEQLMEIECRANRYLMENHAVEIQTLSGEALEKMTYRSKKALEGDVRLVTFPGADCCACCGTHVALTGEIGLVKFLSCQRFRDGVRIELVCGNRAYRCLRESWEQNRIVAQSLSVKPDESAEAVGRLKENLNKAKLRAAHLENQLFAQRAEEYRDAGDVLLIEEEMPGASVQKLCDAVARTCGGRCAVFAGRNGAWRYALGLPGGNLRVFNGAMNEALHGRGGGKPEFTQGSAACSREEIMAFFACGAHGVPLK